MNLLQPGLWTIVGTAMVFALIALPLMLRKIPRNVIYGFRTRTTMSSDAIWYDANAHFGRGLLAASIVSLVGVVALHAMNFNPVVFVNAAVAMLLIPCAIATLRTFRYVRTL